MSCCSFLFLILFTEDHKNLFTHSVTGPTKESSFETGLHLALLLYVECGARLVLRHCSSSQKLFQMKLAARMSSSHQSSLEGWALKVPQAAPFLALSRFPPDRLNYEENWLPVAEVQAPAVEDTVVSLLNLGQCEKKIIS